MTAPIAQPTALAAKGSWRGPRLSRTVPKLADVAPTKMAPSPTGAARTRNVDEKSTATPPNATTAPISLAGVRRSSPIAPAMSALVSGMVA